MVWKRAAGVIVAGTLLAGCTPHRETPKASAPIPPMDEGAVSSLEQSWRAAHPGSLVGHVNAVDSGRHILSVSGLPLQQVHDGDVVSILLSGQANNVVPARVFGQRDGFVQMDFGPLQAGQNDPRQGDLAIWFSGGQTPNEQGAASDGVNTPAPMTQPGSTVPETASPPPRTETPPPPETAPPPPATAPTVPATPPAGGAGNPPPPPPDKNVPADLNK